MILAIEGAPGVGKSTTASALARHGALVIPEVNKLFAKPQPQPSDWYCDRQNSRWEMALLMKRRGDLAILDGDPFQPIWLSWLYPGEGWPPIPETIAFFRRRIADLRMDVPDRYVFVHVTEAVRVERMLARERARGLGEERAQAKTAHYARMVVPQRRFFTALAERFPGWVHFVDTTSLDKAVAQISGLRVAEAKPAGLDVLDFSAGWMATHAPATAVKRSEP